MKYSFFLFFLFFFFFFFLFRAAPTACGDSQARRPGMEPTTSDLFLLCRSRNSHPEIYLLSIILFLKVSPLLQYTSQKKYHSQGLLNVCYFFREVRWMGQ
uniref:Secreted protein n=1 Tax=Sus scrofa TaxID=9823 RepID=A0A4X1U4Y1_PIG